ncbi:hypothetical protein TRAPUB_5283 [Trametes pubescens]|uniref:Uncharacterized protein n=1 Tax=Trametes pubescens TaxID=154538 RepID=A0A1M2V946_TRAPU|nr:hypothetical protein TRAPUB_5283 [Trametes pubescens]
MSQSTSSKRRRETVSSPQANTAGTQALPLPIPPGTATPATPHRTRPHVSDITSPPRKKQKDGNTEPVDDPADAYDPDLSGGDEATDGGIQAIASVTRRARRTRLLSADEKRHRFKEKYEGLTPEEILGPSLSELEE